MSTYTYDNRNRLTNLTRTIDGTAYALGLGYDPVGNVTSILYPGDATPLTQVYDELNRLKAVNGFAGTTNTQGLWYDLAGRLTKMQYNNGITTDYHYNTRGLLSRIHSSVLDLNYTYDSNGNVTSINNETYTYDGLNRMLTANQPAHNYTVTYQYDAVGNRISQVENGISTSYTYNAINELKSSTGTTYTYDKRGNLVQKVAGADTWVYTYDPANRLKEVKKNSTVLGTYFYDANGIRAKKVEGGQTTHYLALGHKNLYEKTGTVATKHIFVGSQRIAEVKNGVVTYYHNDHLGSPRVVTNASGTVIATTGTRPFGQPHSTNNPTDYLFTGKELDDTGLYYFAARYYDPSVGRFVTEDSWQGRMAEPSTQNMYVYVTNNPLRYVDPTGHIPNLVAELDIYSGSGFGSGEVVIGWVKAVSAMMASAYVSAVEKTAQVGRVVGDITGPIVNWAKQSADKVGNSSSNGRNSANPDPNDPVGKNTRDQLLESAENQALKNTINELYRPGATIGDGGTADMIRHEIAHGGAVEHALKGFERVRNLQNILRTQPLSPSDRVLALQLLNDLQDALSGLRR